MRNLTNLADFNAEIDTLPAAHYIWLLKATEKCPLGCGIYHEGFAELPSFREPFGKKVRVPCAWAVTWLAQRRFYLGEKK